jgi:rubredoxin
MPEKPLKPPVDIETLRAIVRNVQHGKAVDYDTSTGFTCRLCGHRADGRGRGVRRTMYQSGGLVTRYLTCPKCGLDLKGFEPRGEESARSTHGNYK